MRWKGSGGDGERLVAQVGIVVAENCIKGAMTKLNVESDGGTVRIMLGIYESLDQNWVKSASAS